MIAPLSLRALSMATNTDPMATDEGSLRRRADQRQFLDQQHENGVLDQLGPADRAQALYFQGANNRDVGGLDHQWSPFFEGVQESGERATGDPSTTVKMGRGLDLMDTDSGLQMPSAVPASIAALGGGGQADWYPNALNPNNPYNVKRNKAGQ